jgi:thiol:disulfide interchange protein/DsbC/DsbD-like thiol-disulfide interchange protein
MIKFIRNLIICLSIFGFSNAIAQSAKPNVTIELITQNESISAGQEFHIALRQKIAKDWHTYWRNPGDVGDATRIEWIAPNGVEIGNIEWPAPKKLPYSEFVNYGYETEVVFPIKVKIAQGLSGPQNIIGKVSWLECKDVCIPGEGQVSLIINVGETKDSQNKAIIDTQINNLPKPLNNYTANWVKEGDKFHIGIISSNEINAKSAYFYPYEVDGGALIDHAKPQELTYGIGGFGLYMVASPSLPSNMPSKIGGVIEIETAQGKKYYEVFANVGDKISPKTTGSKAPLGGSGGGKFDFAKIIGAIGFAVLGGIILNFMPCVFPVLAMKILGLTKIAHGDNKIARQYGFFYALGVLTTFAFLGGLLFALNAIGGVIGWGFQLQDPSFLVFMIAILIALGFNLLGYFEIGTNLQGFGSGLAQKSGNMGAFFSGTLAVMVASPCTAPFMGSALGFAITQPPIIGLLVFLGLGIGMALPFVLLTISPKLLAKMPKPGTWMDKLKKALSIPMFLTAAWLVWVLTSVTSFDKVLQAVLGVVFMFAIFHLARTKQPNIAPKLRPIYLVLGVLGGMYTVRPHDYNGYIGRVENENIKWSQERVDQELANGHKVFVNFTADWCITCKVNEKSVFENSEIKEVFAKQNITYLVADWTKKDDKIARALSSHGRVGVPMYLIYVEKGQQPKILPQLLTPKIVKDALVD